MHPAGHAVSEEQSQTQRRTPAWRQGHRIPAELLVTFNQFLTRGTQPDLGRFF